MSTHSTVAVNRLHELLKADANSVTLIDVRTPPEYRAGHVPAAASHPLDQLDPAELRRRYQPTDARPLHVICKSGGRSAKACAALTAAGVGPVVSVEGGTDAWVAAGHPTDGAGNTVMSLERQVRIAAGLLVVIGSVLGLTISLWFLAIPLFVGSGLTFAGLTDWCGMGLLLARMPWNR